MPNNFQFIRRLYIRHIFLVFTTVSFFPLFLSLSPTPFRKFNGRNRIVSKCIRLLCAELTFFSASERQSQSSTNLISNKRRRCRFPLLGGNKRNGKSPSTFHIFNSMPKWHGHRRLCAKSKLSSRPIKEENYSALRQTLYDFFSSRKRV